MKLNLIAAVSQNGVIGAAGRLPWRLPDDLDYFFRKTAGGVCVLGRKAFAEVPKTKLLAGRQIVVLTRDAEFAHPGVRVARSREEDLEITEQIRWIDSVLATRLVTRGHAKDVL